MAKNAAEAYLGNCNYNLAKQLTKNCATSGKFK
jgi:hypothetical protein